MIEFCRRIRHYSADLSVSDFLAHEMAYDAIVRNVELLGEAARQIPEPVRDRTPEIAWREIVGLRNILIHSYFGIDDEILWDVVTERIQPLANSLEALEASLSEGE
jgi:uncharacterized protein with HEPN domain